jgi:hypothetical protein
MDIKELRRQYHERICREIIRITTNPRTGRSYPNFADGANANSREIAYGIVDLLEYQTNTEILSGQSAGGEFEQITRDYLDVAFHMLEHLQPGGEFIYRTHTPISDFEQYEHLAKLERLVDRLIHDDDEENRELATALGHEYIVVPDIAVERLPVSDEKINEKGMIIDRLDVVAKLTPIRLANSTDPAHPRRILHASISCKWTIRSDRSQNARTEALNLMRNRAGTVPHICTITAEPLPTRIQSIASGTGDIDAVYHFALHELKQTVATLAAGGNAGMYDQLDILNALINGKRLRDISDLPFDLL